MIHEVIWPTSGEERESCLDHAFYYHYGFTVQEFKEHAVCVDEGIDVYYVADIEDDEERLSGTVVVQHSYLEGDAIWRIGDGAV